MWLRPSARLYYGTLTPRQHAECITLKIMHLAFIGSCNHVQYVVVSRCQFNTSFTGVRFLGTMHSNSRPCNATISCPQIGLPHKGLFVNHVQSTSPNDKQMLSIQPWISASHYQQILRRRNVHSSKNHIEPERVPHAHLCHRLNQN